MQAARGDGDVQQPSLPQLPRRGVLVCTVLAAASLLSSLLGLGGESAGTGAPYGVAGCDPGASAGPVDVTVTARALASDGSPAPTLGGGGAGPEVGASVRDLAGYAAQGVAPCDVVQVTVFLHDPAAGGAVPASLQRQSQPQQVEDDDGRGRLVAVDWSTWAASLPDGARSGDLQQQASWLVTLVEAEPGTYRLTGRVAAQDAPASGGDVEVVLVVAPAAASGG